LEENTCRIYLLCFIYVFSENTCGADYSVLDAAGQNYRVPMQLGILWDASWHPAGAPPATTTRSGRPARVTPLSPPNEDLEEILHRALRGSGGSKLENITLDPTDRSLDLNSWLLQVEQSFRVHAPDKTSAERTDWAILQLRGRAAKWWSAMVLLGEREAMLNAPNPWEVFCAAIKKEFKPKKGARCLIIYSYGDWSMTRSSSKVKLVAARVSQQGLRYSVGHAGPIV